MDKLNRHKGKDIDRQTRWQVDNDLKKIGNHFQTQIICNSSTKMTQSFFKENKVHFLKKIKFTFLRK